MCKFYDVTKFQNIFTLLTSAGTTYSNKSNHLSIKSITEFQCYLFFALFEKLDNSCYRKITMTKMSTEFFKKTVRKSVTW